MFNVRNTRRSLLIAGASLALASSAGAAIYTDGTGDNYGGPEVDIASVSVTNDTSTITFQVNLNSTASIGPTANYYANYEVGIQENGGTGGQTAINYKYGQGDPTVGNPYGNPIGISTGMNYFIGSYLAGPGYPGGAALFSYSSASGVGWQQVGSTAPVTEVYTGSPSTSFTFPLSALGLSIGSTFNFDVYSTFSGDGAFDALDDPSGTPNYNSTTDAYYADPGSGGAYNSSSTAQGSNFAATTYTVSVPEPATFGLLSLVALAGLRRRSR